MEVARGALTIVVVVVALIGGLIGYLIGVAQGDDERSELETEVVELEQQIEDLEMQIEANEQPASPGDDLDGGDENSGTEAWWQLRNGRDSTVEEIPATGPN